MMNKIYVKFYYSVALLGNIVIFQVPEIHNAPFPRYCVGSFEIDYFDNNIKECMEQIKEKMRDYYENHI